MVGDVSSAGADVQGIARAALLMVLVGKQEAPEAETRAHTIAAEGIGGIYYEATVPSRTRNRLFLCLYRPTIYTANAGRRPLQTGLQRSHRSHALQWLVWPLH